MRPVTRSKSGLVAALLLLNLGAAPSFVNAQTVPKGDAAQLASAFKLPAGVERVASVEGVTEYRLQNGLRILVSPDKSKEAIGVNITYLVGSRHENYGETGMAHLLEHLLFKGTPKHPTIWKEFKDRGADIQGTTSRDRTHYYEVFAATDENLEWALELEADRMVNSFIAKKDLDSEMTVVRNEMEAGENDPGSILFQRVLATAFEWHSYGKSVIGARSDVENVPIERLQAFYRTYYRPDNAVLIVVGKVSEQKVVDLAHKHFSPIPRPEKALPRFYTTEPPQDGERVVTLRRVGDNQIVLAGYHAPPTSHPDVGAFGLAIDILGNTPSGRLHKRLVESKKASSVASGALFLRDSSYVVFQAVLRKGQSLADARDALEKTLDGAIADPPTKEEVEGARIRSLNAIEKTISDPIALMLDLNESVAQGDWRLTFFVRDRIRKASVEDVKRVAAKYLKPSNRTVGLYIPSESPDRATIPVMSDEQIAAMMQGYKGDAAATEGEAFDPSPANIEARTARSEIGGMRVALLRKKTRGNSVIVRLSLQMGDEKSLMHRGFAGAMTGSMLMRGTVKHTRQQLQDELDRLKATGTVSGNAIGAGASFQTTRENLPALMRLIAEVLRAPSFPASEFEQLRQATLANIEAQRSEPEAIAGNALGRHLNVRPKGHVQYVSSFDEQTAGYRAVTLDQVKAFHRDFYGASHGQLTIVGDFDAAEMSALAKELFGGWKSRTPYVRIASQYRDFPVVNKSFETPDKANAIFVAYQPMKVRDRDADYPALVLAGSVIGGGTDNRLLNRLRQKDGLSYGAGGSISADALDPVGQFRAGAIYAPQNLARVEAAFKEEIARALKDGLTAEELERARKGWLEGERLARSQDGALSGYIHNLQYYERTLAWYIALEKKIEAVTLDDANRALRKYLDLDKMIIVKAGDFANAKGKPDSAKTRE